MYDVHTNNMEKLKTNSDENTRKYQVEEGKDEVSRTWVMVEVIMMVYSHGNGGYYFLIAYNG